MKTTRLQAADVKTRIPPADFYRAELPAMPAPRGAGWRDGGLCPFHSDRHAGSFKVNLSVGSFVCFSCGAKGSDIVSFVQMRDGLSFPDAVAKLAEEWGLA